jgi:hypothetical protein
MAAAARHPVIKMEWRWLPKEQSVELALRQIQVGTFFRLPLDVEIVSAGEKTRHRIRMEKNEVRLKLPHENKPEQIVLDPEEKILMTTVE